MKMMNDAGFTNLVTACLNCHEEKEPSPIRDFFSAIFTTLLYNDLEYNLSSTSSESGANIRTMHSREFFDTAEKKPYDKAFLSASSFSLGGSL
jgi:hypothetical protein